MLYTRGKTITYPSCTPGAHFHPSKRGKESPPLEVCELPPIERNVHAYIHIHTDARICTRARIHASLACECVCLLCIHRGIPHPLDEHYRVPMRPRVLALWVQRDGNTMKRTGDGECVRARTRDCTIGRERGIKREMERENRRSIHAMV